VPRCHLWLANATLLLLPLQLNLLKVELPQAVELVKGALPPRPVLLVADLPQSLPTLLQQSPEDKFEAVGLQILQSFPQAKFQHSFAVLPADA
jgi:hypothetical protein